MTRWWMGILVVMSCSAFLACTGPVGDPIGSSDSTSGEFALTNTTSQNPANLLRGQGLKVYADVHNPALLAGQVYKINVHNDSTNEMMLDGVEVDVRVTEEQTINPYALLFDVGQEGEVGVGDSIRVELTHENGSVLTQIIGLYDLRIPGWAVEEVDQPELYACTAAGDAANAFAVGGQDPGETVGEVHVAGRGFPAFIRGGEVNVYVVEARDDWMGEQIPQAGEAGHIHGPVQVTVSSSGAIEATGLGFTPELGDVGIYDILVDVGDDATMDYELAEKDSGDGVGEQIGFTVQYSQAWIRARGERHLLVNIAFNSSSRSGQWANDYTTGRVYAYLNPPVMHRYHFAVTKWIVAHQEFNTFWNSHEVESDGSDGCPAGSIPFAAMVEDGMAVPVQRGCTNSGPVDFGPAAMMRDADGAAVEAFDMVFDRNGDGCYMPGEDLLDVVGSATSGDLVTFDQLEALEPADRVGFRVL